MAKKKDPIKPLDLGPVPHSGAQAQFFYESTLLHNNLRRHGIVTNIHAPAYDDPWLTKENIEDISTVSNVNPIDVKTLSIEDLEAAYVNLIKQTEPGYLELDPNNIGDRYRYLKSYLAYTRKQGVSMTLDAAIKATFDQLNTMQSNKKIDLLNVRCEAIKLRIELFNRIPSVTNMIILFDNVDKLTLHLFEKAKLDVDEKLVDKYDKCKNLALGTKNFNERNLAVHRAIQIAEKVLQIKLQDEIEAPNGNVSKPV